MKIDQVIDSLKSVSSQATAAKGSTPSGVNAGAEANGSATGALGGTTLNISQLSTKLQNLESRLADGETFDAQRVSEIKLAIGNGSFKVDAEAVADKLLAGAHDLFVKRH
mgnify:CR=1 FL=1